MCVISQQIIKTGFLLSLAIFYCCISGHAGQNPGVSSLPKDEAFIKAKITSSKILQALYYEQNEACQKAIPIWKNLSSGSPEVKDHIFYCHLVSRQSITEKDIPDSEPSKRLVSQYLSWNRQWNTAVDLINHSEHSKLSIDTYLELIRLHLYLGRYDAAEDLIERKKDLEYRKKMQLSIYQTWLFVLAGNHQSAMTSMRSMEENYLYIPLSTYVPSDFPEDQLDWEKMLEEALIRFPGNDVLFERLVKLRRERQDWNGLEELVESQRFLEKPSLDWRVYADIYVNTGRYEALYRLLRTIPEAEKGPDYLDYRARAAVASEDWEKLREVVNAFKQRFPELDDGALYEQIYLEKPELAPQ